MSETPVIYDTSNRSEGRKTELQFIAKRLVDFAKDFENLTEVDKKYVIERSDTVYGYGLVDLYNALLEYIE